MVAPVEDPSGKKVMIPTSARWCRRAATTKAIETVDGNCIDVSDFGSKISFEAVETAMLASVLDETASALVAFSEATSWPARISVVKRSRGLPHWAASTTATRERIAKTTRSSTRVNPD